MDDLFFDALSHLSNTPSSSIVLDATAADVEDMDMVDNMDVVEDVDDIAMETSSLHPDEDGLSMHTLISPITTIHRSLQSTAPQAFAASVGNPNEATYLDASQAPSAPLARTPSTYMMGTHTTVSKKFDFEVHSSYGNDPENHNWYNPSHPSNPRSYYYMDSYPAPPSPPADRLEPRTATVSMTPFMALPGSSSQHFQFQAQQSNSFAFNGSLQARTFPNMSQPRQLPAQLLHPRLPFQMATAPLQQLQGHDQPLQQPSVAASSSQPSLVTMGSILHYIPSPSAPNTFDRGQALLVHLRNMDDMNVFIHRFFGRADERVMMVGKVQGRGKLGGHGMARVYGHLMKSISLGSPMLIFSPFPPAQRYLNVTGAQSSSSRRFFSPNDTHFILLSTCHHVFTDHEGPLDSFLHFPTTTPSPVPYIDIPIQTSLIELGQQFDGIYHAATAVDAEDVGFTARRHAALTIKDRYAIEIPSPFRRIPPPCETFTLSMREEGGKCRHWCFRAETVGEYFKWVRELRRLIEPDEDGIGQSGDENEQGFEGERVHGSRSVDRQIVNLNRQAHGNKLEEEDADSMLARRGTISKSHRIGIRIRTKASRDRTNAQTGIGKSKKPKFLVLVPSRAKERWRQGVEEWAVEEVGVDGVGKFGHSTPRGGEKRKGMIVLGSSTPVGEDKVGVRPQENPAQARASTPPPPPPSGSGMRSQGTHGHAPQQEPAVNPKPRASKRRLRRPVSMSTVSSKSTTWSFPAPSDASCAAAAEASAVAQAVTTRTTTTTKTTTRTRTRRASMMAMTSPPRITTEMMGEGFGFSFISEFL
ncbi:hypothetical protein HDU97_008008 [Phlyctochytrium planicorne]|nr:hypothetical protein HDU97_008008 [Phlyctochytrium planicorne]